MSRSPKQPCRQEADSIFEDQAEPQVSAPSEAFSRQVALGMASLDVQIRRPSGAIKIPGVKVMASNGHGDETNVKRHTRPGFIVDDPLDHEFWAKIDENGREIAAIVERSSVNDAKRGFHLVPMGSTGAIYSKLLAARAERAELVKWFAQPEQQELWKANLRAKYPDHHHILLPRLPSPEKLLEKFNVVWDLQYLTPMTSDQIDYRNLNDFDRARIEEESNKMARELVEARAAGLFRVVFGSVLEQAGAIAKGSLETGVRKFAGISDLITQLERLRNFEGFVTPEMVAHVNTTLEALSDIKDRDDIKLINRNKGQNAIVAAVKRAIAPLGEEIRAMYDQARIGSGTARRSLE